MNHNSPLYLYNQYYPNIPMSREVLFTCNCRFFWEELPVHINGRRLCPVHKTFVYRYIFTCCDCGRMVYRKTHVKTIVCKSCRKVRQRVYTKLYNMKCFEFEDDDALTGFGVIGKELKISRQMVENIYHLAIRKLKKKSILKSIWKVINEPMDRERFNIPLTIED